MPTKSWYNANREAALEYGRKWRAENREFYLEAKRQFRLRNRERLRLESLESNARIMPAGSAYQSWAGMKQRCLNPKATNYVDYGGRGITICDKWMSFKGFYEDMGDRPVGKTLDRQDNDGPYNKDNCTWSSPSEQAYNRRPKGRSQR